jgi:hypothetical protein
MPRFSFVRKLLAAAVLVGAADLLLYGMDPGSTLGAFALLWVLVLAISRSSIRQRQARLALAGAAGMALVLFDDPSLLGWAMFWMALTLAALLPRHPFDDAFSWARRLVVHGLVGLIRPARDLALLLKLRPGDGRLTLRSAIALLLLPVVGSIVFVALFAQANPLIGSALSRVKLPGFWLGLSHLLFWTAALLVVWPSLRPHRLATRALTHFNMDRILPHVRLTSILLSLGSFNLIFAVQNVLDIVFLWSGAALPGSITMADYAHRGAYSLIVTALLAGLFVLVVLRPGGEATRSPWARWMVVLWTGQNILLVASSMVRTIDYIEAYSLTVLRLAALAWMALVAVGLALICFRLLRGLSSRWLINSNAAAAVLVLTVASVVDLGAVAASWNVRHSKQGQVGTHQIDLCYLAALGPSALLPLVELHRRSGSPELLDRTTHVLAETLTDVRRSQGDWRSWTWRNARRLDRAERALLGQGLRTATAPVGRSCDGRIIVPRPPTNNADQRLTGQAQQ